MSNKETISQLKKQTEILKKEDFSNKLNTVEGFAEELHNRLCHFNHIDQCAYEYENSKEFSNPNSTKGRWAVKAKKLMDMNLKLSEVITILEVIHKG